MHYATDYFKTILLVLREVHTVPGMEKLQSAYTAHNLLRVRKKSTFNRAIVTVDQTEEYVA